MILLSSYNNVVNFFSFEMWDGNYPGKPWEQYTGIDDIMGKRFSKGDRAEEEAVQMTNINIKIDGQLKFDVEAVLSEVELTMIPAITIFAKAIIGMSLGLVWPLH